VVLVATVLLAWIAGVFQQPIKVTT